MRDIVTNLHLILNLWSRDIVNATSKSLLTDTSTIDATSDNPQHYNIMLYMWKTMRIYLRISNFNYYNSSTQNIQHTNSSHSILVRYQIT